MVLWACFERMFFFLPNVAVNCTMDSEALSHRAPRGGWMGMRMLFTKSSQPSAHWCSVSPNIIFSSNLLWHVWKLLSPPSFLYEEGNVIVSRPAWICCCLILLLVLCNSTSRRLCKSVYFAPFVLCVHWRRICLNHTNCDEIRPRLVLTCVWKYNYKHLGKASNTISHRGIDRPPITVFVNIYIFFFHWLPNSCVVFLKTKACPWKLMSCKTRSVFSSLSPLLVILKRTICLGWLVLTPSIFPPKKPGRVPKAT